MYFSNYEVYNCLIVHAFKRLSLDSVSTLALATVSSHVLLSVSLSCSHCPALFQETDVLEEEKAELEAEISELQKEKERLEFVLIAHQPGCKIPYQEEAPAQLQQLQQQTPPPPAPVSVVGLTVKEDTFYLPPAYSSHHHHLSGSSQAPSAPQPPPPQQQPPQGMMQEVAFSSSFYGQSQPAPGGPCLIADGGGNPDAGSYNPSYTSSFVFTYPEGACGVTANQRTSSSEQSSDSLNSPSLLAL